MNNLIEDWIIFSKTQQGNDEILRRSVGLPSDLRSLLLLIDGRRDVAMLRNVSISLRESSAPLLYLEDNGFVIRSAVNDARLAQFSGGAQLNVEPRRSLLGEINQSHLQAQTPANPAPRAQPQPMQPAPMQNNVGQSNAGQNYAQPAPSYPAANVALNEIKSAMIQFVSASLGADGSHAVGRIQSATSLAELQGIARKIYEILKSYSGVKGAENFMQRFEGPLNLR
jgi:hypothetical protein